MAAPDRFSTAVAIARRGFTGSSSGTQWGGIRHVIIASGEDRAAADPLSAAGLCWAYDAPLLLVSSTNTPAQVKAAVREIASQAGGTVTIHIVGGTVSVPDARYNDLKAYVGSAGTLKKHRVAGADRFSTAAAIAYDMRAQKGTPSVVLIANGADDTKFFDALALSPIAAQNGYPIVPVSATSVPSASEAVLRAFKPATVIIGGGPNTVTSSVKSRLKSITGKNPEQWYGNDRYSTAAVIAGKAVDTKHWLSADAVGVAAKLPDALTGGSMVGKKNGVLLVTDGSKLSAAPKSWITSKRSKIYECFVFGGTKSVTPAVKSQIDSAL